MQNHFQNVLKVNTPDQKCAEVKDEDGGFIEKIEKQTIEQNEKILFKSQSAKLNKLINYIKSLGQNSQISQQVQQFAKYDIPKQIIRDLTSSRVIKQSHFRLQRLVKTNKIKRNWSIGDLVILLWLVFKYSQLNSVSLQDIHTSSECWVFVSGLLSCSTPEQCLFRWMAFKKHKVAQFGWCDEEDYLLKSLQKKHRDHPNKWKILAQKLYKLNTSANKIYRQAKQCKEHFNSFLDPSIRKGLWSKQQDLLLFTAYLKFGCKRRWCLINKFFSNRTQNSLKNRFQLLHSRLILCSKNQNEDITIRKYIEALRNQIMKLQMEDSLVYKADLLLKEIDLKSQQEYNKQSEEVEPIHDEKTQKQIYEDCSLQQKLEQLQTQKKESVYKEVSEDLIQSHPFSKSFDSFKTGKQLDQRRPHTLSTPNESAASIKNLADLTVSSLKFTPESNPADKKQAEPNHIQNQTNNQLLLTSPIPVINPYFGYYSFTYLPATYLTSNMFQLPMINESHPQTFYQTQ